LVFSVGGIQLIVTVRALAVGGVPLVEPELAVPDDGVLPEVVLPEVVLPEVLLPEVVLADPPLPADVPPAGAVLCAAAAEELPLVPPPQPESANPSAATAHRPTPWRQPRPRLAFLMLPPNRASRCRHGGQVPLCRVRRRVRVGSAP
jgi:hypothetical protein